MEHAFTWEGGSSHLSSQLSRAIKRYCLRRKRRRKTKKEEEEISNNLMINFRALKKEQAKSQIIRQR